LRGRERKRARVGREWQGLRLTAHNARTNRTETFHKIRAGEIDLSEKDAK